MDQNKDVLLKAGRNLLLIIVFPLFLSSPILAQPQIPGSVEPAKVSETLVPTPTPPPKTPLAPSTEPEIKSYLTPEAEKITIHLQGIRVTDTIIFCEDELIAPFRHLIGTTVTLKKLQEIANKMTDCFQKAGFVLTQVILPEQKIKDGIVTLQVIAGHVDQIKIEGCIIPCVASILMEYGCAIKNCYPLQMKVLERYSLLANDIPGMNVKVLLKPSKTTRGASDLIFKACQDLETASVAVNNYSSPFLGPQQIILTGTRNSWLVGGDETQVMFLTSADKKFNFGQVRHGEYLNCDGLRYNAVARYTRANPGTLLAPLNIAGTNSVVSLELSYPCIRSREENLFLQGGFFILDDRVNLLNILLYNDRIRPIYGTIIYSKLDECKGVNQLELTITQGLKILNASGKKNISRPGGDSGFTKFYGSLSRNQALLIDNYSLYGIIMGQYSLQPLLVSTQFSVGGPTLGRGYDPSEIIGDHGMAASAELRYDVPYFAFLDCYVQKIQYYGFLEGGWIRNFSATPPPQVLSIMSTGLGARVSLCRCIDANLFIAKPLTKKVTSLATKPWRGYFSLSMKF